MTRKKAAALLSLAVLTVCGIALARPASKRAAAQAATAVGIEKQLADYAALYLPYDPGTKVTVEKGNLPLPGFTSWRIQRTGRYESMKADAVVFVSNDRKWFFEGDSFKNRAPKPVRSAADLDWVTAKYSSLFRAKVGSELVPARNAAGLKGVAVVFETGFGPARYPGLVTPDGSVFLAGTLWDFQSDPRAERRRRLDLSAQRAQGSADAPLTIVEFADLECNYCRYRGRHLDRLVAANSGVINVRRHYKFFPLWSHHAWSMKAASAADCLFRLAGGPVMFRFKELVYSGQESLSVSAIDELAITFAEGEGVARSDFLGCYLRDESFDRVRREIDEGYRLGVNSTPTYYVDGTQISWVEDKVMEDFLRTKVPKLKSITYEK